jgi:single-stranded DNA-binding protein
MDNSVTIKGKIQKIFPNTTGTGKRVANFTLLWQSEKAKYYFKCVAWEDMAREIESIGEGGVVKFNGSLRVDSWEKEGRKIYETKINVYEVTERSVAQQQEANQYQADDDVPF